MRLVFVLDKVLVDISIKVRQSREKLVSQNVADDVVNRVYAEQLFDNFEQTFEVLDIHNRKWLFQKTRGVQKNDLGGVFDVLFVCVGGSVVLGDEEGAAVRGSEHVQEHVHDVRPDVVVALVHKRL